MNHHNPAGCCGTWIAHYTRNTSICTSHQRWSMQLCSHPGHQLVLLVLSGWMVRIREWDLACGMPAAFSVLHTSKLLHCLWSLQLLLRHLTSKQLFSLPKLPAWPLAAPARVCFNDTPEEIPVHPEATAGATSAITLQDFKQKMTNLELIWKSRST